MVAAVNVPAATFIGGTVTVAGISAAIFSVSWIEGLPPFISAVVAGFAAWLSYRQRKNENDIAAVDRAQTGTNLLLDQLQEQLKQESRELNRMRMNFSKLYRVVLHYRFGLETLVNQLKAADITPNWEPDDEADRLESLIDPETLIDGA